jgi:hypothetical protein
MKSVTHNTKGMSVIRIYLSLSLLHILISYLLKRLKCTRIIILSKKKEIGRTKTWLIYVSIIAWDDSSLVQVALSCEVVFDESL